MSTLADQVPINSLIRRFPLCTLQIRKKRSAML